MPDSISLGTAYPIYMYLVHFKEIKCTVCKLRIKFYFVGIFGIEISGDSISSNPERTASRRKREDPSYIEVLQQRTNSLNIRRLLLKKNRKSKLRNLVILYL